MELKELREVFRTRMKEEDFCIGEEQVEKLFRELLGEPEPPEPKYSGPHLTAAEIGKIADRAYTTEKINKIFERDNAFYAAIMRRK